MPIIVGIGGLYVGLNATTSIIQTYIVETYLPKAAHAIASFNLIKCAFAFAVPFFVPDWAIGDFTNAYAIQASLGLGLGLALCFGLIALGKKIRRWQGQ